MTGHSLVRLAYGEIEPSDGFAAWLAETGCGLVMANGGRLFLVGLRADGSIATVEPEFPGVSAVAADGERTLFVATTYQIWRLENALPTGSLTDDGHDRLYVPQAAWTTGRLGVRGLAATGRGDVVVANTRFSCLATVDERLSFAPRWLPPFVSTLAPDDRCHLTGVALDGDGEPAYVTCAAQTDVPGGWQEDRRSGGVVLRVPGGEVVAAGLSLPHSPVLDGRLLWLADSGNGRLGCVDTATGTYRVVAELPGFVRGLALHGGYAVIGVSKPPRGQAFDGLPLADRLAVSEARCGAFVVDLATGRVAHRVLLHGVAPEIDDLELLTGGRWPTAVGFQGDDVQELVTLP